MWIEPILLGKANIKIGHSKLTRDIITAQKQTEILKEIATRVGSQVSAEKTEHKHKTST